MHTQIYERETQEFEVLADIGTLLKLKIKDKTPPCTIMLSSPDHIKTLCYCYISDEFRVPSD